MLLTLIFLISTATMAIAQTTQGFSISGKAVSVNSGKPIVGGSIIINKNLGTTSDTAGNFSIKGLRPGNYKLSFRYLNYEKMDTVIWIEDKSIQNLVLIISSNCKWIIDKKHKESAYNQTGF